MLTLLVLLVLGLLVLTNERITNLTMSTDTRFSDANDEMDALDNALAGVESDSAARDAEIADLTQKVADLIANSGMSPEDSAALTALVARIGTARDRVVADDASFPVAAPVVP